LKTVLVLSFNCQSSLYLQGEKFVQLKKKFRNSGSFVPDSSLNESESSQDVSREKPKTNGSYDLSNMF